MTDDKNPGHAKAPAKASYHLKVRTLDGATLETCAPDADPLLVFALHMLTTWFPDRDLTPPKDEQQPSDLRREYARAVHAFALATDKYYKGL